MSYLPFFFLPQEILQTPPMVNTAGCRAAEEAESEDKSSTWGELTIHTLTSLLSIDSLVQENYQRVTGATGGHRQGTSELNQCL